MSGELQFDEETSHPKKRQSTVEGGAHMKKIAKHVEKKLHDKGEKDLGKEKIECYESTIVNTVVF